MLRSPRPWPRWGWESRDLRRPRAESGLPLQRRACRACVQAAQRGCLSPTSSGLTLTRCSLQSETNQLTLPGRASFRLGSTESWRPFKRLRLCRAQGEHCYHRCHTRHHHHHYHRHHHYCRSTIMITRQARTTREPCARASEDFLKRLARLEHGRKREDALTRTT